MNKKEKLRAVLGELFLSFAKIGAFTFGGGYAMIALLEDECTEKKGWLSEDELMNIIVLAESTPGPIAINCATYTGYKTAGMPGALAATVGIVLPSFLILFLISQFFESFLQNPYIEKAMNGVRVAVGLIIMRAGLKMLRNMLRKKSSASKKQGLLQLGIAVFFAVLYMLLSLFSIKVSVILLMLSGAAAGLIFFGLLPALKNRNNKKEHTS